MNEIFTLTVTETVAVTKTYTVEADTYEEAVEKALQGDTVEESEPLDLGEVIGRSVWQD